MVYQGELAALATALIGASNAIFLTLAGRRVGSHAANVGRLVLATGAMAILHAWLFRSLLPVGTPGLALFALGLSGVVGLAVSDALLIEAMVRLGPRLPLTLMALSPVFAVILARWLLGQVLAGTKLMLILVTLASIALVVAERSKAGPDADQPRQGRVSGVLMGGLAALADALGLILASLGMDGQLHAIPACLVRVVAGTAAVGLWTLFRGCPRASFGGLLERQVLLLLLAGAVTGPVLGVVLALYAIAHAPMGIATTLMSLAPVFLLPASAVLFGESISPRAIAATLVALLGASPSSARPSPIGPTGAW